MEKNPEVFFDHDLAKIKKYFKSSNPLDLATLNELLAKEIETIQSLRAKNNKHGDGVQASEVCINNKVSLIKEGLPARGAPPCSSSFPVKPTVSSSRSTKSDDIPCSVCSNPDVSHDVIQCSDCLSWCHFKCTLLPPYQLYNYKTSSRKYKCEKCSNCPAEWHAQYDNVIMGDKSVEILEDLKLTETHDVNVQTDVRRDKSVETQTEDLKLTETHDVNVQTDLRRDKSVETQTELVEDSSNELLERGMVKILDQISDLNKTMNINKEHSENNSTDLGNVNTKTNKECCTKCAENSAEVKELNTKRLKLEQEVKDLSARKLKLEKEHTDMKGKHEKEVFDLKSRYSKHVLESEIEIAKLKGEVEIKQVKISCQTHSSKVIETELNSLPTRFEKKCNEVIELEEKIKSLKDARYAHNEHVYIQSQQNKSVKTKEEEIHVNGNQDEQSSIEKQEMEVFKRVERTPRKNEEKSSAKKTESPTYIGRKFKTNALLVGTSNTRYLSAKFISGNKMYVQKVQKPTVKEAQEFINNYKGVNPDIMAYQITCNDIEVKSTNEIISDMNDLIKSTTNAFRDKPILLSLPLPRAEPHLNQKSNQLTAALVNDLSKHKNITFSDNTNLTFRGRPLEGILYDKKHLSRWGTDILARNLREDILSLVKN